MVKQGQDEVNRGYQPKIVPLPVSVKDYDVIAVGTPTWWYTMAPAVLSFVKAQDFNGKTVIPFMTNGGWPGDHLETPEADIDAWAESVADLIKAEKE